MVKDNMSNEERRGPRKLVSLILTTYNCKDMLVQTLQSIEQQTYPSIELIIVDGNSTDGTVEAIEEYSQRSPYPLQWISEPDQGIYDAINKGIGLAKGDYIEVMNDEYSVDDAIEQLVQATESQEHYVGAHADLVYADQGVVIRAWKMGEGRIGSGWMPGHPTLLLESSVYNKYGLYDTTYTCSADYEFMVRFLTAGEQLAYVPQNLVSMYYGGTSTATLSSYLVSFREAHRALRKNHVRFPLGICLIRTVRVLWQFVKK